MLIKEDMPGLDSAIIGNRVYYAQRIDRGSVIPGSPNNTHIVPSDGWYGMGQCGTPGCLLETSEYNGSCQDFGPLEVAPAGWSWVSSPQFFGFYCGPAVQRSMPFRPGTPTVEPYDGQSTTQPPVPWPTSGDPGTNGEPPTTTRDRLKSELENNPSEYPALRDWLCARLGGECTDPTGQLITPPSCIGVSAATCETRLQAAGFTGSITTEPLSSDDAVMELPAGKVAGTSPAAGTQANYDADITVYRNPDVMPTMTAEETSIANTLETKNPDTITADNKKTIARTCVRRVTAAGRLADDCASLPVFVTGNDATTPAANDRAALDRKPSWVLLHARDTGGISGSQWYRGQPGCETALRPGASSQCHEFPFWTTLQAHNGAFNSGPTSMTPSISWTPQMENSRQGGALRHFFSSNLGGSESNSFPFNGCNIPKQVESTLPTEPGLREIAAAPSAFLNVPLGRVPFKTVGFCNKPTVP